MHVDPFWDHNFVGSDQESHIMLENSSLYIQGKNLTG